MPGNAFYCKVSPDTAVDLKPPQINKNDPKEGRQVSPQTSQIPKNNPGKRIKIINLITKTQCFFLFHYIIILLNF